MTRPCRACRTAGRGACENRAEVVAEIEKLAEHRGGSALFQHPELFRCRALEKAASKTIDDLEDDI